MINLLMGVMGALMIRVGMLLLWGREGEVQRKGGGRWEVGGAKKSQVIELTFRLHACCLHGTYGYMIGGLRWKGRMHDP